MWTSKKEEKTKHLQTEKRYLTELVSDIIKGGSGASRPRSVVGEHTETHVPNHDPLLGPGSAQYVHTVCMIV